MVNTLLNPRGISPIKIIRQSPVSSRTSFVRRPVLLFFTSASTLVFDPSLTIGHALWQRDRAHACRIERYVDWHSSSLAQPPDPLSDYTQYSDPNWDGLWGRAITPKTLNCAREFLRILPGTLGEPAIAPGADGIIALEWVFREGPLRKLFIDIGPGDVWSAYYRRANGGKQTFPHQRIAKDTKAILAKLFDDLSR